MKRTWCGFCLYIFTLGILLYLLYAVDSVNEIWKLKLVLKTIFLYFIYDTSINKKALTNYAKLISKSLRRKNEESR